MMPVGSFFCSTSWYQSNGITEYLVLAATIGVDGEGFKHPLGRMESTEHVWLIACRKAGSQDQPGRNRCSLGISGSSVRIKRCLDMFMFQLLGTHRSPGQCIAKRRYSVRSKCKIIASPLLAALAAFRRDAG
jgi:hypothetical protein